MQFEISLNNLLFYSYHGVFEEERKLGNQFKVDLSVFIPVKTEIEKDNLEATVSYAALFEIVKDEMESPKKLLEKISLNIAQRIKTNFPQVEKGSIRIEKMKPPIPEMIGSASVTLSF